MIDVRKHTRMTVGTRRQATVLMSLMQVCIVAACVSESPDAPTQPVVAQVAARTEFPIPKALPTYDDELMELASQVPGFAGMTVDKDGALEVTLARSVAGLSAQGREHVGRFVTAHKWSNKFRDDANPRVRMVDLDAGTLLRARKQFEDGVRSLKFTPILVDFDEDANQINVVVRSARDSNQAVQALRRGGLPLSAIRVEVGEPIVRLQTLKDNVPPLRGGMNIYNSVDGPERFCSVGPPMSVYQASPLIVPVVFTASHCTSTKNSIGANGGDDIFQSGQLIGKEIIDRATFIGSGCPAGNQCRRADLAVIQIQSGLWALNTIANTGAPHGLMYPADQMQTAPYPLTIVDQDTVVAFETYNYPKGTPVRKQGRTTGTTQGNISKTCVTLYDTELAVTLLCQNVVNAQAGPGDSGGPVYYWIANPPWLGGNAIVVGMVWGGKRNIFTNAIVEYYYSPSAGIASEAAIFDN